MKVRLFTQIFVFMLISSYSINAQFDDLYYDYTKDQTVKSTVYSSASSHNEVTYAPKEEYEKEYYDNDEYDNYDEYAYSTRIRRFHRPFVQNVYYSSFDNWWVDDYYDPYYSHNSVNIYIGNGWNAWNRPWGYSYWNRPWGWNSWNAAWGWNSWNNPYSWNAGWGWNSWNNPYSWNAGWGWNSWNNCPPYGYGNNIYYGNVYYGNGNNWNGNGWNNSNDNNKKVYGSRKGGSLSSSTSGRDASPRRIVSGGNSSTNVEISNDGLTESLNKPAGSSNRSYKGDVKTSGDKSRAESSYRSERSRIYSNPDRGNNGNTSSPDIIRRNDNMKVERSVEATQDRSSTRTSPNISNTNRNSDSRYSTSRSHNDNNSSRSSSRSTYDNSPSRSSSGGSYDSGSSRSSGSSMGSSRSNSSSSGSSNGSSSRSGGSSSRRGG